jgi:hypothetical protein
LRNKDKTAADGADAQIPYLSGAWKKLFELRPPALLGLTQHPPSLPPRVVGRARLARLQELARVHLLVREHPCHQRAARLMSSGFTHELGVR